MSSAASKPPPREKLLTLGDATLHTDDLALLVPPAWLNDAIISFWTEHLRLNKLATDARVAILPPNISFFLALCTDTADVDDLCRHLHLDTSHLILLTVNDSSTLDPTGLETPAGTHWSLLVFERCSNTFYYLDSLPSSRNQHVAKPLAQKLNRLLNLPTPRFVTLYTPTQQNGYDCGAYVCMFAEDVILNFQAGNKLAHLYNPQSTITPAHVEAKRQEIGKLVSRLLDNQQRSQQTHNNPTRATTTDTTSSAHI